MIKKAVWVGVLAFIVSLVSAGQAHTDYYYRQQYYVGGPLSGFFGPVSSDLDGYAIFYANGAQD